MLLLIFILHNSTDSVGGEVYIWVCLCPAQLEIEGVGLNAGVWQAAMEMSSSAPSVTH